MRCLKARSYLSAFCNDELDGRKAAQIREHLNECSGCRNESQVLKSLSSARRQMPLFKTSDDFNARLLNRVANERFAETRTSAMLPRRAPILGWPRLATVSATVMVMALAVGISLNQPTPIQQTGFVATTGTSLGDDDSYLTAQPQNRSAQSIPVSYDWSFSDQLRRTEWYSHLTNSLTNSAGFSNMHLASANRRSSDWLANQSPLIQQSLRIRPVWRVYNISLSGSSREGQKDY